MRALLGNTHSLTHSLARSIFASFNRLTVCCDESSPSVAFVFAPIRSYSNRDSSSSSHQKVSFNQAKRARLHPPYRHAMTNESSTFSSAYPRFVDNMDPHDFVFQLAKTGKAKQLKQYLNKRTKDERKRIVSAKLNGATSLIMSCKNGYLDVVEYLVDGCGANIEQTGLVNFEGENIEGAPPLWCASAAGHLKIVKYLVSKGANVNSTTKSNSTALRAACFDGHFEIVKYLVENHADIEVANRHGHTCLMIACYKGKPLLLHPKTKSSKSLSLSIATGHHAIAKYLINKNADINRKSVKGNTALHDCAECGSLEIMKLLLQNDAKMEPDAYNMTPLLAAAVTGHSVIVEFLLTRSECTQLEKIHALELLGATFVDKKHDMMTAYNHWKKALVMR
jgi:ankyrin repeat protein